MPLIILTGYPSSGKTTVVKKLREYFVNADIDVHVVSEEEQILKAGFDKNNTYEGTILYQKILKN